MEQAAAVQKAEQQAALDLERVASHRRTSSQQSPFNAAQQVCGLVGGFG